MLGAAHQGQLTGSQVWLKLSGVSCQI